MITIENLVVSYDKNKPVLDLLNLTLSDNTINGIVGLNGSGKTTLLNAIYGLKRIDSGSINHNHQKINKKEMSFLETESYFYPNITAREYLGLFKNQGYDLERWNKLFLLPVDTIIDEFSTGMKKKLALMGILKQDKQIMILDEPFNSLDIESCRIIRQILLKLKDRGKTIIVTSHVIETLTNLCDYIHYLDGGKIKYSRDKSGFEDFQKEIFTSIADRSEELINELIE